MQIKQQTQSKGSSTIFYWIFVFFGKMIIERRTPAKSKLLFDDPSLENKGNGL